MTNGGSILLLFAGRGYESGGIVVSILGVSIIFAVFACFFSYCILIPNHYEKYFFVSTIIAACVNICLNLFFIPWIGVSGAATTTLISEIIVFSISLYYGLKCTKISINKRNVMTTFISSMALLLVCYISIKVFKNYTFSLMFSIIVGGLVYFAMLFITKNNEFMWLWEESRKKFIRI